MRQVAIRHLRPADRIQMPDGREALSVRSTVARTMNRTSIRVAAYQDLCGYPILPPGLIRDGCFILYGLSDTLVPTVCAERNPDA